MTTKYRISTTDGGYLNGREYGSEAEAQEALRSRYGSDIHIELAVDRWLVWASEAAADAGKLAIASIS